MFTNLLFEDRIKKILSSVSYKPPSTSFPRGRKERGAWERGVEYGTSTSPSSNAFSAFCEELGEKLTASKLKGADDMLGSLTRPQSSFI